MFEWKKSEKCQGCLVRIKLFIYIESFCFIYRVNDDDDDGDDVVYLCPSMNPHTSLWNFFFFFQVELLGNLLVKGPKL